MAENADIKREFIISHEKTSGRFHWGIHFFIDYKDRDGKRDIYMFLCLGKHEISIGWMADRDWLI